MENALNKIVLNLLEATVTLYPADAGGAPVLSAPIWLGAPAEKLTVRERWRVRETTPTGARYPRRHPLIPDYDIRIGRVWLLQQANLVGWVPDHRNYVLDVVWLDAAQTGFWHRRTYYGVTIAGRDLGERDMAAGFTDDQEFAAQYFQPSAGGGYPPDIAADLPYTVRHTDARGVPVLLYSYDWASRTFTAQADTAGRASITATESAFAVQFDGETSPSLQGVNNAASVYRGGGAYRKAAPYRGGAAGLMARSWQQRAPRPNELPRLDFFYGPTRVASLTRDGLFDAAFAQVSAPGHAAGRFAIYAGDALVATVGANRVEAMEFITV